MVHIGGYYKHRGEKVWFCELCTISEANQLMRKASKSGGTAWLLE